MTCTRAISKAIEARFCSSDYQLMEKIGEGGFGRVYKARRLTDGQWVAIKFLMLKQDICERKRRLYIERFQRETELCNRLDHPHIVKLLHQGVCDDDLLFAVFEFVDGLSLKQWLVKSGPLEPNLAAEIMVQLLDAINHAHTQGVIHRDIKPANVMIETRHGQTIAKILDFGIGTWISEVRLDKDKSLTLTQETLGTPAYCAPEQLRGDPPTPKTDLYVWGLLFIECLTGQPAVRGGSVAALFHQQLSEQEVLLPQIIKHHPLAAILWRVLQKPLDRRNVTAQEILQQLQLLDFTTLCEAIPKQSYRSNLNDHSHSDVHQTKVNDLPVIPSIPAIKQQHISALCVCINIKSTLQKPLSKQRISQLQLQQKHKLLKRAKHFGAYHVGTLGDTLLFYFGYPADHKDTLSHARLAATTALDIKTAITKDNEQLEQNHGIVGEFRIGIHSGKVMVFDDAPPQGDTPDIAMSLSRHAKLNQILCTEQTRQSLPQQIQLQSQQRLALGVKVKNTQTYAIIASHKESYQATDNRRLDSQPTQYMSDYLQDTKHGQINESENR